MVEQEQIRIGAYCHELLEDARFNELASLIEVSLSQDLLQHDRLDDREKVYYTYQGFKYLLDTMREFVLVKDQILAKIERDNE